MLTFAQRIAAALGTLVVGLVAAGIAINFARRRLEYLAKTNQAITDQVDTWKNPLSSPIDKVVAGVLAFLLRTGSTSSTGGIWSLVIGWALFSAIFLTLSVLYMIGVIK